MAEKMLNTRIVLRNDSSINWLTNSDQILLKGEVGIEFLSDGKAKMKIGDGVTTWANLPYFGGEESHIIEPEVLAAGSDHIAAINTKAEGIELAIGDIAIIKEDMSNGKIARIAYVYNGVSWQAMSDKIPVEDNKTIEISDEGIISLAGVTNLIFEKTNDDSGEITQIKYQPILDKNGITWIESNEIPSEDLVIRITAVESTIEKINEKIGNPQDEDSVATGLYAEISNAKTIANSASAIANENAAEIILVKQNLTETNNIANEALFKINAFMDENAATDETVNTLKEIIALINSEDSELSATLLAEINKLKEQDINFNESIQQLILEMANKVNTKKSIYNGIETEWTLLSPENQAKLASLVIGDEGNIEISGKVNVENVEGLPTLLNNKVDTISISNGSVEYETGVVDANGFATKVAKINLGVATNALAGAVKGISLTADGSNKAEAMNKIAVAEDGTMEVNSLNVNKLTQDQNSVLVLYGGSASDNI